MKTNFLSMKNLIHLMILVGIFNLISCSVGLNENDVSKTSPASKISPADAAARRPTTPPPNPLYFQTDFTNVQVIPHSDYMGFNPYNLGMPSTMVSECDMGFAGSFPTYANAEIVSDNNRNVLKGSLYGDDPNFGGVTRFQTDIITQPTLNLSVYHFSQRMFLNPDLAYLSQYPSAINEFGVNDWTILFEVWNQVNTAWDGDGGGSARWDLSLAKDAGTGNLFWELSGEYMQPAALQFHSLWTPLTNKTVAVPFGQWFTLDFFMKRGEGTAGQLIVSIQPDGGTQQVLFNTNNSTIYPSHPELNVHRISPFKLYMSPTLMDFMNNGGKNMNVMYNDFKWYQN